MVAYFMVKSFLIIIICQIFANASQQVILVLAENENSQKAMLYSFENGEMVLEPFEVNIGENGVGAGEGELLFGTTLVKKYEGDKKSPVGVFALESVFGYEDSYRLNMPYLHANNELICVDDSNSIHYNQIIKMPEEKPQSFEKMKREDAQYELGVVVAYNKHGVKERGSCIFLHVAKSKDAPTSGCISMSLEEMKNIVFWLDKSKNPTLIQIKREELDIALREFKLQLP